jgi:hypothetical protein
MAEELVQDAQTRAFDTHIRYRLGLEDTDAAVSPFGATQDAYITSLAKSAASSQILTGTANLTFGLIAAGAVAVQTITVTGATVGKPVDLVPPAALEAGLIFSGFVSAANTVSVRLENATGAGVTPAAASTWKAVVDMR